MKKALAILGFVLVELAASQAASASPIYLTVGAGGISTDLIIGEVFSQNDIQGSLAFRDETMIDTLRVMSLGERTDRVIGSGNDPDYPGYYRSLTSFGSLPDAVSAGHIETLPGGFVTDGNWIVITLNDTYSYLVGSYDGPNGGSEVWYIGGLAAGTQIYIPQYAHPAGSPPDLVADTYYQATSWTAFNPTSVPDGGTTAALLGLAMVGMGFARRLRG